MKAVCLIGIILMLWQISAGQVLRKTVLGASAYSNYQQDAFSFTVNQASLADLENSTAGIYNERRFMLSALNSCQLALALITPRGNIGLKGGYSGSPDYNESQAGLAYARKIGKKGSLGVQFNYNAISMGSYGGVSAITAEAGAIFHLTDQLHTGIHVSNPAGGKFGKTKEEKISTVYTIGLGYDASRQFFTSLQIIKAEMQPVNVDMSLQYLLLSQIIIRTGVSTGTSLLWIGAGVIKKNFRVDVVASFHPQLGMSPGLQLIYNFKKKKAEETSIETVR